MEKLNLKNYYISDTCLCWSFGDSIDPRISEQVLSIYKNLKSMIQGGSIGILDVVPSYNAVAVHFRATVVATDTLFRLRRVRHEALWMFE